jgi:hypothetical protein
VSASPDYLVGTFLFSPQAWRVRPVPGTPCALCFERATELQDPDAKSRRGNAKMCHLSVAAILGDTALCCAVRNGLANARPARARAAPQDEVRTSGRASTLMASSRQRVRAKRGPMINSAASRTMRPRCAV